MGVEGRAEGIQLWYTLVPIPQGECKHRILQAHTTEIKFNYLKKIRTLEDNLVPDTATANNKHSLLPGQVNLNLHTESIFTQAPFILNSLCSDFIKTKSHMIKKKNSTI